jgi:hypothetical protein
MTTALFAPSAQTRGESRAALTAVLNIFAALFAMTALAAYNVGPVPVPWVAQTALIGLAVLLILSTNRVRVVPGGSVLFHFLAWTLFVQVLNAGRFGAAMPNGATSSHLVFVLLRYLNLCSFVAALYVAYWLLTEGLSQELTSWVVRIGVIASVAAIYIYVAQQYGLPEPARTRMGTDGGIQTVFFGYRRALGTFREPSHLAEWLLLPFFLSMLEKGLPARISSMLIGLALLLTVSLGGIASCLAGIVGGFVLNNPLKPRHLKSIIIAGIVLGVILLLAQVTTTGGDDRSVYSILNLRTLDLVQGGAEKSNRAYIADLVEKFPPPAMGYGLGNANIFAAGRLGVDMIVSFLSLYINVAYSSGLIGLVLLSLFLVQPILRRGLSALWSDSVQPVAILMGYIAYLFVFAAGPEELSIQFAIMTAFLLYNGRDGRVRPSQVSSGLRRPDRGTQ